MNFKINKISENVLNVYSKKEEIEVVEVPQETFGFYGREDNRLKIEDEIFAFRGLAKLESGGGVRSYLDFKVEGSAIHDKFEHTLNILKLLGYRHLTPFSFQPIDKESGFESSVFRLGSTSNIFRPKRPETLKELYDFYEGVRKKIFSVAEIIRNRVEPTPEEKTIVVGLLEHLKEYNIDRYTCVELEKIVCGFDKKYTDLAFIILLRNSSFGITSFDGENIFITLHSFLNYCFNNKFIDRDDKNFFKNNCEELINIFEEDKQNFELGCALYEAYKNQVINVRKTEVCDTDGAVSEINNSVLVKEPLKDFPAKINPTQENQEKVKDVDSELFVYEPDVLFDLTKEHDRLSLNYGRIIVKLIEGRKLTKKDLKEKIKISEFVISALEKGDFKHITIDSLDGIFKSLIQL